MQITITEDEIKLAIRNHILSQISVNEGRRIKVDLRATRGEAGYTAIIDILDPDAPGSRSDLAPAPGALAPAPKVEPVEKTLSKASDQPAEKSADKPAGKGSESKAKAMLSEPKVTQELPAPEPDVQPQPEPEVAAAIEAASEPANEPVPAEEAQDQEVPAQAKPDGNVAKLKFGKPAEPSPAPENAANAAPKKPSIFAGLTKPSNAAMS